MNHCFKHKTFLMEFVRCKCPRVVCLFLFCIKDVRLKGTFIVFFLYNSHMWPFSARLSSSRTDYTFSLHTSWPNALVQSSLISFHSLLLQVTWVTWVRAVIWFPYIHIGQTVTHTYSTHTVLFVHILYIPVIRPPSYLW